MPDKFTPFRHTGTECFFVGPNRPFCFSDQPKKVLTHKEKKEKKKKQKMEAGEVFCYRNN